MPSVTITFNPNNSQPISCNPDPVHVPHGNNKQVTWQLSGQPGVVFANKGIDFSGGNPGGGSLTRVSDTQYQLTENNTNMSGQTVYYKYNVTVTYQGQKYELDPEVGNDPGTPPL